MFYYYCVDIAEVKEGDSGHSQWYKIKKGPGLTSVFFFFNFAIVVTNTKYILSKSASVSWTIATSLLDQNLPDKD